MVVHDLMDNPVHAGDFGRTLHPWNAMQPDSRRVDIGHIF